MPGATLVTRMPAAEPVTAPDVTAIRSSIRGHDDRWPVEAITVKPKASVWRVRGAGARGSDVIVKRAVRASARVERTMYEGVLPHVAVMSPAYFGSLDDADNGTTWLFVEDVGEGPFLNDDPEHRRLAARWLGRLHADSQGLLPAAELPDRGPEHFLRRLVEARMAIRARLSSEPGPSDLAETLAALLEQCRILERGWPEVEAFCAGMPKAIVHGDLAALNLRISPAPDGPRLAAFDWEKAGCGVPVVDLGRGIDLEEYWAVVHDTLPGVSIDDVRRMALLARVFRPLSHNWSRKSASKLHDHYVHMSATIDLLGWSSRPRSGRVRHG